MQNKKQSIHTKNVFTIIPRHNSHQRFTDMVLEEVAKHQPAYLSIVLMQPADPAEQEVAAQLNAALGNRATIRPALTVAELCDAVDRSTFVVTQRYHGALAALARGVPVRICPMGDRDKLSELLRYTGEHPQSTDELAHLTSAGEHALREAIRACAAR